MRDSELNGCNILERVFVISVRKDEVTDFFGEQLPHPHAHLEGIPLPMSTQCMGTLTTAPGASVRVANLQPTALARVLALVIQ
jgi:hypothetical protein